MLFSQEFSFIVHVVLFGDFQLTCLHVFLMNRMFPDSFAKQLIYCVQWRETDLYRYISAKENSLGIALAE